MKILTIVVPCYNSEAYMKKCIDSVLTGGEDVEIIIVDDGSKDKTAMIADEYARNHSTVIKVVHQENGGHGEAVNTGLRNASGIFFKVVDSDDWVDEAAYKKVLKALKSAIKMESELDLLLTNFVYDKVGVRRKKTMRYKHALKEHTLLTWSDGVRFNKFQYILMHSVIYRTQMLRDCNLELPKHTFYVDNIFIFKPLPYVRKLYYLDVDFYHYFIGRNDQSVNEKVMISRLDQQIRVNKCMIDFFSEAEIEDRRLYKYMFQYLDMMMCVSSIMAILSKDRGKLEQKAELWQYLKEKDLELYHALRTTVFGIWMNLPGHSGRMLSKSGYKVMQKVFGFN